MPRLRTWQAQRVYSFDMPNPFNFAVDYYVVCILALASYVPGSLP